jgi:hypothetical protein
LVVRVGEANQLFRSVSIQENEKLVLAGSIAVADARDILIARVFPDGRFDDTFSADGKTVIDLQRSELIRGSAIHNDRLYLAGTSTDLTSSVGMLAAILLGNNNQPPIAGAWLQKYYNPTTALLAACDSRDPEGAPITYWWEKQPALKDPDFVRELSQPRCDRTC